MAKKKKEKKKEKLETLYLDYVEYNHGGEVCEGQENDDWPNYEDAIIEFHLKNVVRNKSHVKSCTHEVNVDEDVFYNDKVYTVIVRYSTGNTFGRTFGCWYVEGIYKTEEEAQKVNDEICNKTYNGYKPWEGYFERLGDVEVHEFDLNNLNGKVVESDYDDPTLDQPW